MPPGAADGEVHTPAPLQKRDQAIDGRGVEGIAADEQRMEAQGEAQPGILDEGCRHAIDGPVAAQPHQLRGEPNHVEPGIEWHVPQALEGHLVNGLARGKKRPYPARSPGANRLICAAIDASSLVQSRMLPSEKRMR